MQEPNKPPPPKNPTPKPDPDVIAYYKRVLEKFPSPAVLSDNFDRNIYVNQKFTEVLGYSVEDVSTTEQWGIRAYPDSGYRNVIHETAPGIGTEEETLRVQHVRCKDGTIKNITFQDFPVDEEYFITIMEDISEKIETQQHLMEAEERYERIVHNFPIPITVSLSDMRIIYLNKEFERVFGYDLTDIPNNNEWVKLAYPDPDYRAQITHDMGNVSRKRILWNRERRITCKDGTTKMIVINSIPIGTDETLTIFQNVTPLRTAEEQAQEQADEYRKIIEDASDIIIQLSRDRIIRRVNPACTDSLGYLPSEMIGRDFREFVDSNYWDRMDRMGDLKFSGHLPRTIYEIEMIKKDKTKLFVEMNTRFTIKNEKFIVAIAMIRDISTRKRETEEQIHREKIDSIGILAGGIAHDFNNILTSILGSINLLQLSDLSDEDEDILGDLEKGTLRAKDLTNQLLTFSKGGAPLRKIETISNILIDTIKFALRGSRVEYSFEIGKDLPSVNVDGSQLSQVINNLTINAMQAMPEGGNLFVRAKIAAIQNRQNQPLIEGDYVLIEIEDTGMGIPLELQKHIFEPYFSTKATGSGLGLATAYSIIYNHDGWLTFSSNEQGTIFYIYLPTAKSLGTSEDSAPPPLLGKQLNRILFLDDDKAIHTIMQGFCAHLGIEVDSVYNSQEFLENFAASQASAHPYDLIITDLTLPGDFGGDRIIELIREQDSNIPVVVSSGYSNDPIVSRYKEYGFNGYLKKPYTIEQLKATFASLFRKM
ncbi:MAG: PAS domain-containing hybrid sensor histidine kinase/response regulator [Promethearchaeota archaeon]